MSIRLYALAGLLLALLSPAGQAQPVASLPCLTEQGLLLQALGREALTPQFLPSDPPQVAEPASAVVAADGIAAAPSPPQPASGGAAVSDAADPIAAFADAQDSAASAPGAPTGASAVPAAPTDIAPPPAQAAAAPNDASAPQAPTSASGATAPDTVQAAGEAARLDEQARRANRFLQQSVCVRVEALRKTRAEQNFIDAMSGRISQGGPSMLPGLQVTRGTVPGEGSVGLKLQTDPSWNVNVGVSNAGMYSSGKMQSTVGLFLNQPLGLDGTLNTSLNQDLQNARYDPSNRGLTTSYTLPWNDDWTFGVSGTANMSSMAANETNTGSQSVQWTIGHTLDRSYGTQTGLLFSVNRSLSEDYTNQQRSDSTYAQIGLTHSRYIGIGRLDFTLTQQVSAPGVGGVEGSPGWSYHFRAFNANLSVPFY